MASFKDTILTSDKEGRGEKVLSPLGSYALFLREHHLEAFVKLQLHLSRIYQLPILKYFEFMPEEELIQLSLKSNAEFLTSLVENTSEEYLQKSLKNWKENQLHLISREQLVAEDFTLGTYIRKEAFLKFLQGFTADAEQMLAVIHELDGYLLKAESMSIKIFLDLQNEKIGEEAADKVKLINSLESAEKLYKYAEELSHTGNWTWDITTNKLLWTDEMFRIYELPLQSEITFDQVFTYTYPEDTDFVSDQIKRSLEDNQPVDFDYRIILNDGRIKFLRAKVQIVDKDGPATKLFGTLQDVTEQRLFEKELREKQLFLQKIANAAPSLITAYNVNSGKYLFISEALKKLLGYDPQELLARGTTLFTELIHPDDLESLLKKNEKALLLANSGPSSDDNAMVLDFEYRLRHKNGEYRWFHTYGTVFDRNREGKVEHILNISVDVTESHILRRKLEEEKYFAEMITEMSAIRIMALDKDLRYIIWNKECEKYYGKTKSEVIGRTAFEVLPDMTNNHLLPYFKRTLEGELIHLNEEPFSFAEGYGELFFIPLKKETGEVFGVLFMVHDLTEIKQTADELFEANKMLLTKNEELRQSEERYHKMIKEVNDYAILLLDIDGKIENWNEGAEKIKGYKAEEIVGKNFRLFYAQEDRDAKLPEKLINLAKEEGKALHEGWRVRKDGTKFWGSVVITALHDENNQVIGFSKVTRDLSERKKAEDSLLNYAIELDRKNKELESSNKELNSFSFVASHDLQEPLRKIQTFGRRILEKELDKLSESGQDGLRRMINASDRMQKLIQDLLAFSRANASNRKFEEVNLNEVLEEVKSSFRELLQESQGTIEYGTLPSVYGIPFQIQQLIENIINNSIKYHKPDVPPQIQVYSKLVKGTEVIDVQVPINQQYHMVSFVDNGIGFDQKHANKIFEIFQRLHGRNQYPGTGIGLAICKRIIENHQGFITAQGAPEEGATFRVYFPAYFFADASANP